MNQDIKVMRMAAEERLGSTEPRSWAVWFFVIMSAVGVARLMQGDFTAVRLVRLLLRNGLTVVIFYGLWIASAAVDAVLTVRAIASYEHRFPRWRDRALGLGAAWVVCYAIGAGILSAVHHVGQGLLQGRVDMSSLAPSLWPWMFIAGVVGGIMAFHLARKLEKGGVEVLLGSEP